MNKKLLYYSIFLSILLFLFLSPNRVCAAPIQLFNQTYLYNSSTTLSGVGGTGYLNSTAPTATTIALYRNMITTSSGGTLNLNWFFYPQNLTENWKITPTSGTLGPSNSVLNATIYANASSAGGGNITNFGIYEINAGTGAIIGTICSNTSIVNIHSTSIIATYLYCNPGSAYTTSKNTKIKMNFTLNSGGKTNTSSVFFNHTSYPSNFSVNYTDAGAPWWTSASQNISNPHRGEYVNISALWSDGLALANATLSTNESVAWKNYTDGTYNSNVTLSGVGPTLANFTWRNVTGIPRVIGWIIYGADYYSNNINGTNCTGCNFLGNFTLWGWSNITWASPSFGSSFRVENVIQLLAFVNDTNITGSGPIQNYPVNFYWENSSQSTLLGTNYTNSSGYAVWNWDTTGLAAGTYYPKTNITNNSTLFYNASEYNNTNTTITLNPPCYVVINETQSCYQTVQSAINAATNGQTVIILKPKWFNENVVLNRSITLTSNSSTQPTINSTGTSLLINANNAIVTNLTIAYNGTSYNQNTVWITGNGTTVANNTITMAIQPGNYPIYIQNSANNTIYGNNITSHSYSDAGIFISGSSSTNNTINTNNITYDPTSSYGLDIEANNNTIKNNNITTTGGYLPIYMNQYYSTNVLTNNYVNGEPAVYNSTLQNSTITATTYGELILANSFNMTINSSVFTQAGILFLGTANSTISSSNITTMANAIFLDSASTYNTIYNNNISTSGGDRSYGITTSGNYVNITKNNITITGAGYNFAIYGWSWYSTISSNVITTTNYGDVGIYFGGSYGAITNNNISTTGVKARGIWLSDGSNYNNVTNCNITTTGAGTGQIDNDDIQDYIPSALQITNGNSNTISNCILNSTNYYDIFVSGTSNQVNYLINDTFNKTDIYLNASSNSQLYNQYTLDAKVQDSFSNPLNSANVFVLDNRSSFLNTSGLVGWWKFDEGSGSTASDSSGNGNTGTLGDSYGHSGPAWTSGKFGGGLLFNNNSVSLLGVTPGNKLTMAMWVKPIVFPGYQVLVGVDSSTAFLIDPSGYLRYYESGSLKLTSSQPLTVGMWQYVVFTSDGTTIAFYINGIYSNSATYTASSFNWTLMGNDPSSDYFHGTMDEVQIWNRSLSANEISGLYETISGNGVQTNSSGYVPQQILSQFLANWTYNSTNGYLYLNNYTVNASKTGFTSSSQQLNLTSNSLLTFTLTDNAPPTWSSNSSSIVSTYSPNSLSQFNITWNDNVAVSQAIFESNFSGTPTNYTTANGLFTFGNGIWSYNNTLPAGTYYWKSYANDTSNNWNTSNTWYFTIAKTIPVLVLSNNTLSTLQVNVNTTPYSSNTGYAFFVSFEPSSNMTVSEIGLDIFSGATGNIVTGIYNDTGSTAPGTLLAVSSSIAVVNGWNDLILNQTVSLVAGTQYWLAETRSAQVTEDVRTGSDINTTYYQSYTYNGGLPSTASGLTSSPYGRNMRVTYGQLTSVNTSGLVGYWRFENESLGTAMDYSGYGNNGTLTNMNNTGNASSGPTTSGMFGEGMQFDGVDDYVNIPSFSYPQGQNYTACAWFNVFGSAGTRRAIFETGSDYSISLALQTDNHLQVYEDDNLGGYGVESNMIPSLNTWYFACSEYNGTSLSIWVDGSYDNSNSGSIGVTNAASGFHIGTYRNADSRWFNGTIDEVQIWNRSLTANEIRELYQSQATYPTQTNFTGSNCPSSSNGGSDVNCNLYRNTTPVGNTVLLLHMDGTNGSTTFTDSSLSQKTVTSNGGASIDTSQSVFGGASGKFVASSSQYLSLASSSDFTLGTNDFTIDFWWKPNSLSNQGFFAAPYDNTYTNTNFMYYYYTGTRLSFESWVGGTQQQLISYGPFTPTVGTWYHIAIVRSGSNLYLFVNGVIENTHNVGTTSFGTFTPSLLIGEDSNGFLLNGWLDEFRVSKGIARWTSNFSPPIAPYTSEQNDTQTLGAGLSYYVYNTSGGQNYTSNSILLPVNISKGIPVLSLSNNTASVNTTGLVGYWKFDEGSGTNVSDSSGNGNNGTLKNSPNVSWVNGYFGGGLYLNGTNGYVNFGNPSDLSMGTSSFTLTGWVNTGAACGDIIQGTDNDANHFLNGYAVVVASWAGGRLVYGLANSTTRESFTGNTPVNDSKWHYFSMVVNRTNSVTMYLDGKSDQSGSDTLTGSINLSPGNPMTLGNSKWCNYFNGTIDEVQMWNRALSQSEINELYQSTATYPTQTNFSLTDPNTGDSDVNYEFFRNGTIAGDWHFDEGSGNTAFDSSGNGNTGTLNNATNGTVTWTTGMFGNAMNFSTNATRGGAFVNITGVYNFNKSNAMSATFWMNPASLTYRMSPIQRNNYQFFCYMDSSNGLVCGIFDAAGQEHDIGFVPISTNTWYFVGLTYNGTMASLYLNGVLAATPQNVGSILNNSGPVYIGRYDSGINPFNGTIDEVKIYPRALSAAEILCNYGNNCTVAGFNNETTTLGAGLNWYSARASGGQNYTTSSLLLPLNISQGIPALQTYLNNISSSQAITYPNTIEIRGNFSTAGLSIGNLYANSSSQNILLSSGNPAYNSTLVLGAGIWTIVYNVSGIGNWSAAQNNSLALTVSKGNTAGTLSTPTVTYPTPLSATSTESDTGDSDVPYYIYCGNYLIGLSTGSAPSGSLLLGANSYSCVLNTTGGANWSSSPNFASSTGTVNIGIPPVPSITYNPASPITYGTSDTANASVSSQNNLLLWNLYRDNTTNVGSGTSSITETQIWGAGTKLYCVNTTGNTNYTSSAGICTTLTINPGSQTAAITLLPSSTDMTGTQTTANCARTGDPSSIITLYRGGAQVASGSSSPQSEIITLPIGTYDYTCTISATANASAASSPDTYLTIIFALYNYNINGTIFNSQTGAPISNGFVNVTVKETGDRGNATITNGAFNLVLPSSLNINQSKYTIGIVYGNGSETGYSQIVIGNGPFATQTQSCTSPPWHFSGFAIDSASGSPISSGSVTVNVKSEKGVYSNSTSFTNGSWVIYTTPCLISGNLYTFNFIIKSSSGVVANLFVNQVAK